MQYGLHVFQSVACAVVWGREISSNSQILGRRFPDGTDSCNGDIETKVVGS